MALGIEVINTETPQSGGFSTSTGTAFVALETDQGPTAYQLIRSLSEYVRVFGPRTTTSAVAYDWVETFFALRGSRLYVARALGTSSKLAELSLLDAGAKPTLTVAWDTAGTAGNAYKIEVVVKATNAEVRLLNSEGELIEANPEGTQAQIIAWWATHTAFVTVIQSVASEHTSNLPKVLAATKLAGGVNGTVTAAEKITALNTLPKSLGPGQAAIPGATTEEANKGLATHCLATNRDGWGDLADSATVATLISNKGTIPTGTAGVVNFVSSTAIINGLTPGTTRTVRGSAVAAALCAQVAATGNDNQAAAGIDWNVSPFVLGFTNLFTQAQMEELVEHGINPFAERQSELCLYGWVSALSQAQDIIFWQTSAARERMRLTWEAEAILERAMFKTIDGRGHLLARVRGELQGLVSRHWQAGALFGETAEEAGSVVVGEPINTPTTEQEGKLNAEMIVRISPYADAVTLTIVSTPISSAV
jgi:hypothetical protein